MESAPVEKRPLIARKYQWLRLCLVFVSGALALVFLAFPPDHREAPIEILLEAESALDVAPPVEVRQDREEPAISYLQFPAIESLQAMDLPVGRKPRLVVDIPGSGSYYLWVRAKWKHVCANSVAVQIDGGSVRNVGNDDVFDRWHWVRHDLPLVLSRGPHELIVAAAESDIQLDRILLAGSSTPLFADLDHIEFKDDLHSGVPSLWKPLSPQRWDGFNGQGPRGELHLRRGEGVGLEYAVRSRPRFSGDIYFRVRARCTQESSQAVDLALVFDHRDSYHYRYIRVSRDRVVLGAVVDGLMQERDLFDSTAELRALLSPGQGWDLELAIQSGKLYLWQHGRLLGSTSWTGDLNGDLGIGSWTGGVTFEEVHALVMQPPSFEASMYMDSRRLDDIGGFKTLSGNWRRGYLYTTPFTYPLEARASGQRAVIVTGEPWWFHYALSVAVRAHASTWAGLVFQFRDPDNYAIVRVRPGDTGGEMGEVQLVLRRRGNEELLCRREVDLQPEKWRVLEVEVTDDKLVVLFDRSRVFDHTGLELVPGRVGLSAERITEQNLSKQRDPGFLLDAANEVPAFFDGSIQVDRDDPGAMLVFLYQDPQNHYRFGVVRSPDDDETKLRLERIQGGRPETLHEARLGLGSPEEQDGESKSFVLRLAVRVDADGTIRTTFEGDPFAVAREPAWRRGRVAILGLMPPADADFDELRVAGEVAAPERSSTRVYEFNPARTAARDFADWESVEGEWNAGIITRRGLAYSLLGRVGESGRAIFRHRPPLEGGIKAFRVRLCARSLASSRLRVDFFGPETGRAISALGVSLNLTPDPTGETSRPSIVVLRRGQKIAEAAVSDLWMKDQWHDLECLVMESGALTVVVDGVDVLTTPKLEQIRGGHVELSLTGPADTVFAFREITLGDSL